MAKKKKSAETESTESIETSTIVDTSSLTAAGKPKAKRGRPPGSKSVGKASKTPKFIKGKRGRPKGSKNKSKGIAASGKRRGRPPGKKVGMTASGLREIITQIVRDEVQAALLQAFKGI